MPRPYPVILFFLTFLALAATAPADVNVQSVLSDLRSENYTVRQHATESLLADDTLSPEDIQKLYAGATLPEQRQRLLDVARHHFLRRIQQAISPQEGAKSMLGVKVSLAPDAQQNPEIGRPALRISATFPGYPAYVTLHPGDLIVSLNDQPLPLITDLPSLNEKFISQIQANPPGAAIRMGIIRDGKMVSVAIHLATTNLEMLYDKMTDALQPPYDAQWSWAEQDLMKLSPEHPPLKVDIQNTRAAATEQPLHLNQQSPDERDADD